MLRRLGIRGKFLAALSVPVLVLFALAGTLSMQAVEDVRVSQAATELLGVLDGARDLTVALQAERAATSALLLADDAGRLDARGAMNQARAAADRATSTADMAATSLDLASLDPVVDSALSGFRAQLAALDRIRRGVDSDALTARDAFANYTVVVERVTAFPEVVANALADRRLATIITAQTATMELAEGYRQEQVIGAAALRGAPSAPDTQDLVRVIPATDVQQETVTLLVQQLRLDAAVLVPPLRVGLQTYGNIRSLPAGGESTFVTFISPEQWFELAGTQAGEYDALLGQLGAAAQLRADEVEAAAFRTALLTITLTVLAVVVSIATALSIARQVVDPLRRLTLAAGQVRDELPRLVEQVSVPGQGPDLALVRIPVVSRDEVGRLAEAFNEVNSTTIQVAQEQAALRGSIAEMFVNVARRDQVLLNRQLAFIDALERSEEDPATLADLFRLDHLATRMRRNAESLLVLAGIDTGRRLREPIPASDVIRTASSEIEHYERIHLDLPVDPLMLGHVALPAAHLLAELLENATVFSDPGTPVQVSTGIDETHVVITVLDQGLGMTAAELAQANAKIRTTSAGDVVGAQRLGLFVVGRIAGRLGAEVELGLGPDGTGTLATVRIPLVLFVETASLPVTAPVVAAERPAPTFATVEEAAAVVHDAAFAPAPEHVQDVSPGSLGSAENPAQEVDLAALTDGRTGHGLPRRRSRGADVDAPAPSASYREQDDAAAAPSIPLAPRADALAGAATLPSDDAWSPAVVEAQPLVARRRADDVDGSAPARTVGAAADASSGPPETRAAMFSGFRSRRAELAAAAVDALPDRDEDRPAGDGADRLAAAAATLAPSGAGTDEPAAPVPMVIPLLEDDDEYPPAVLPVVGDRPGGRHSVLEDDLVWPPPVDVVEDAWGAPAEAAEWSAGAGWQQEQAPAGHVPVAEPAAFGAAWAPAPQAEAPAQQEWAPQQEWAAQQQEWAAPQEWAEPEPLWAPQGAAAPPAVTPWVEPAAPSAEAVPFAEAAPVTAAAPPAEAVPVGGAVSPTEALAPAVAPEAAEAVAAAPARRSWWPFGRGKGRPESAGPAFGPTAEPGPAAAVVHAVAPVPAVPDAVPGPAWPALGPAVADPQVPAAPTHPVRASAWGPSEAGAHAMPSVDPDEPAAPSAPRRGASAFFPAVHATRGPQADPPGAAPATGTAATWAGPTTPAAVGGWDVPSPRPMPPQPAAAAAPEATVDAAPLEAAWDPQAWDAPDEPQWRPTVAPDAPEPAAGTLGQRTPGASQQSFTPAPLPAFQPGPTTFTPDSGEAGFDSEVNTMLAQRADLAQQALAELSQLSTYRPQAATGGSGSLTRRTPSAVPSAPEIATRPGGPRPERDANQVRSLLSSFQSGTSRGRSSLDGPQTADAGPLGAGDEDSPDGPGDDALAPVPTDSDLTQRSTSW